MNMNLNQTKIVGLTMELELKTKIYAKLCDKLEENDPKLLKLKEMFKVNNKQIVEINRQLKEIKK
ncbi:MAG: hypothetical protein RSF67_06005 [Clostridia bacterium]